MRPNKSIKRILRGSYYSENGIVRPMKGLFQMGQSLAFGWAETQLFGVTSQRRAFEVLDGMPDSKLPEIKAYFSTKGMLAELEDAPGVPMMLRRPFIGLPMMFAAEEEDGLLILTGFAGRIPLAGLWLRLAMNSLVKTLPGQLSPAEMPAKEKPEKKKPEKKKKAAPKKKRRKKPTAKKGARPAKESNLRDSRPETEASAETRIRIPVEDEGTKTEE